MSERATRVLLVDDNKNILERVRAVLTPACVVVGEVTDGAAALVSVEALHPDVIVLDLSMPGMSGLEVACTLRQRQSTAAIVFLTVHDDAQLVEAAIQAGGTGYVLKTRLSADLLYAVEEARAGRSFVSPKS